MSNHTDPDAAGGFSTFLLSSGPAETVFAVVLCFLSYLGVNEGDVPPAIHTTGSRVCQNGLSLTIL